MEITLTPDFLKKQQELVTELYEANILEGLEKLSFDQLEKDHLSDLHKAGILARVLNYMKFNMLNKSIHRISPEESARRSGYIFALEELTGLCRKSFESNKTATRDNPQK